MGIDQSYTSCGVVILDENKSLLASQILQTDRKESDFQRSWFLYQELLKLVQTFKVKYLAIEGLAFGKFGNATRSLAILQGVLVTNLQYLRNNEFYNQIEKIEIITPSALKKWATGNGRADKHAVISNVPANLVEQWKRNFHFKSINDLADSYFLATKMHNLITKQQCTTTQIQPLQTTIDQRSSVSKITLKLKCKTIPNEINEKHI